MNKISSLAALEVVFLTSSSVVSDENFINMMTFVFDELFSRCYAKNIRLSSKFPEMYPDRWVYRGFMSCNFGLWWKQNGGSDNDLRKIHGFQLIIYAQTALIRKFYDTVL